eukprot:jgi/Tetstr1/446637/TSEL_034160.t1
MSTGGEPLRGAAVGRRLEKRFGASELYGGVVAEYLPTKRWYLVRYDDGDTEDLTWNKLSSLLLPVPAEDQEALPTSTSARRRASGPAKQGAPIGKIKRGVQLGHRSGTSATPTRRATPTKRGASTPAEGSRPKRTPSSSHTPSRSGQATMASPACCPAGGLLEVSGLLVPAEESPIVAERGGSAGGHAVEALITRYNELRLLAIVQENTRVQSSGGRGQDGKKQSRRPDLTAMKLLRSENTELPSTKVAGALPGIPVGFRFWSRAEMCVSGMHFAPVSGIEYIKEKERSYVVSIVFAGNYGGGAGDELAGAEGEMVYDGAGGNDLLHDKRQIADQTLDRGNLALTGNHEHAIPVRVTRKNKCKESYTGSVFTYDGLWDVVEWWGERPKTEYNPGFLVYRYRLRRRPGQEKTEILSKAEEKEAHERLRQEEKERRAEERERQSSAVKEARSVVKEARSALREASCSVVPLVKGAFAKQHVRVAAAGSLSGSSPAQEAAAAPVPKLLDPPHGLRGPTAASLSAALAVVEFLHTFRHALPALEAAGEQAPLAEMVMQACAAGDFPVPVTVFPKLRQLYATLLPSALSSLAGGIPVRAERWADLLKSKELPFLGDSVAAALLARMCCLPECAGGQPLDLMPGAGHVAALESLCAAALNCVEVRETIDLWMEKRMEVLKSLSQSATSERKRLQEVEATERERQEQLLQRKLSTGKVTIDEAALSALDLEEVRRVQREAKERADENGRLRIAARQAVASAVAAAAEDLSAERTRQAVEAEAELSRMAVRVGPLGADRNGALYWWLPSLPYVVLVSAPGGDAPQERAAEWLGCFAAAESAPLLASLDISHPSESGLAAALTALADEGLWASDGDANGHPLPTLATPGSAPSASTNIISSTESAAEAAMACLWAAFHEALAALPPRSGTGNADVESSEAERSIAGAVERVLDAATTPRRGARARQQPPARPPLDTSALLLQLEATLFAALRPADPTPPPCEQGDREKNVAAEDSKQGATQGLDSIGRVEVNGDAERKDDAGSLTIDEHEDGWRMRKLTGAGRLREHAFWCSAQARRAWRMEASMPLPATSHAYLAAVLAQRVWPHLKQQLAKGKLSPGRIVQQKSALYSRLTALE